MKYINLILDFNLLKISPTELSPNITNETNSGQKQKHDSKENLCRKIYTNE